ncbi:MAG: ATP-binding protein [Gammaproteobacteria bacterium]|nr:ATP-binding protein [Gammaproteobacteria bacterium]
MPKNIPLAEPGDYVRLSVCDTGVGMEPELLERVFDPFFTTKNEGDGTGLGLSVVHGIVVEHGGYITMESREGIGTTVQVHLPVTAEDNQQLPSPPEIEEVDTPGTETVLVVEDEEQVRSLRH